MLVDQMSSRDINGASSRLKRLGIDEKSINMSSLPVLGQIESGKGLEALGNQYLKRSDLSKEERRGLIDALKAQTRRSSKTRSQRSPRSTAVPPPRGARSATTSPNSTTPSRTTRNAPCQPST